MRAERSPVRADQVSVGYRLNNTVSSGIIQQCHMMHRNRIAKIQSGLGQTYISKETFNNQPIQRNSNESFQALARKADEMRTNRHLIKKMIEINYNPSKFSYSPNAL